MQRQLAPPAAGHAWRLATPPCTPSPPHPTPPRSGDLELRPLSRSDFEKVLAQFTPPSRAAQASRRRLTSSGSGNGSAAEPADTINALLAALSQLAVNSADGSAR